ncbi:MAG: glycosyltransferase family 2 protein [Myxococcota bacterium]
MTSRSHADGADPLLPDSNAIELSIVMPCLDEAETVGRCVDKALGFLRSRGVRGEVVVADNGSADGSPEIARAHGARVVAVEEKGYGAALHGGIAQAAGRYVIMGDADDSYDFSSLDGLLDELRRGCDLVMGNRFQGGVLPGAMPWLHRVVGNPLLSALGRIFFGSAVGDYHCGLRGFSRSAYEQLGLRATGMEFASEMVVKATLAGLDVREVPVVLHPDGRSRPPHLRTWRDGWRHLRFMLLFSPGWLFLAPGLVMAGAGVMASAAVLLGVAQVGGVAFGVHTLLVAGLSCIVGYQLVTFAIFTRIFAVTEGFRPAPPHFERVFHYLNLETGLVCGAAMAAGGLVALVAAMRGWSAVGFGGLDPAVTMRLVIPGSVLVALGIQTLFSSFFLSTLGLRRR